MTEAVGERLHLHSSVLHTSAKGGIVLPGNGIDCFAGLIHLGSRWAVSLLLTLLFSGGELMEELLQQVKGDLLLLQTGKWIFYNVRGVTELLANNPWPQSHEGIANCLFAPSRHTI